MKYEGHLFNILYYEGGQALVESEFRKDTAHVVDVVEGLCSCENFTIDKNPACKHIRYMRFIQSVIDDMHDHKLRSGVKNFIDNHQAGHLG